MKTILTSLLLSIFIGSGLSNAPIKEETLPPINTAAFHTPEKMPSLIPLPKEIKWEKGGFKLQQAITIEAGGDSLQAYVPGLSDFFTKYRSSSPPEEEVSPARVVLAIADVGAPLLEEEAYSLQVRPRRITLKANTTAGIRWGIQTLRQLLVPSDTPYLQACDIRDWPSFKIRGIMHDVGRNFIPLDILKEQVRMMSRYKLNTFHWHLTEDIAWRLGSKKYPQLTHPDNMLRNPGMYYTLREAKEFIDYAKNLGVTVIPEIDMPGHSAAFERAMGTDMQSEKGGAVVTELLSEICEALPVPYIHIGGDEVEIYNDDFLPEMTDLVQSYGKQVIGWQPGGNLDSTVIRQLWTGMTRPSSGVRSIDSRHLYFNHNDPLAGVVKTFNREICDAPQGDEHLLGAIACIWPDRRPSSVDQLMRSNSVYPTMLALAERTWRGGGYPDYSVNLGPSDSEQYRAFKEFEDRLLMHKRTNFKGKPFPYIRQTQISWSLIGPFANEGDLKRQFAPERRDSFSGFEDTLNVRGSTIWLRHCFDPYAFGHLKKASPNTTYYAVSRVKLPEAGEGHLWVSFHNPSRSETDDTPPVEKWDYKESKIWLNGEEVSPPRWSKPGRRGHPEAPLLDESYEMRPPILVRLKKGWNTILLKLPVGEFTSRHTRLVKWMFTAGLVEKVDGRWEAMEGVEYSAL